MTGPYPQGHPSMDGSSVFISVNAGKRSLGIDINHPQGRELLYRMAGQADVVCENFTPGTAARLGYGYDRNSAAIREDIIMLSLSMQGQTGPRADQPGLGNHLQAMSGLDLRDRLPRWRAPWPQPGAAGFHRALDGHRRVDLLPWSTGGETGQGQYLDISQFESIMLYLQPALIEYGVTGASPDAARQQLARRCAARRLPGQGRRALDRHRHHRRCRVAGAARPPAGSALRKPLRHRSRPPRNGSPAQRNLTPHSPAGPPEHEPKRARRCRLQARGVRAHLVCDRSGPARRSAARFPKTLLHPRAHSKLGESLMVANSFRISSADAPFRGGAALWERLRAGTRGLAAAWMRMSSPT